MLRILTIVATGLFCSIVGSLSARGEDGATAAREVRFREMVRPFLETYCLACHAKEKPKGDMDLSAYTTVDAVAKDIARWELVLEQLEAKSMPPAKAKRHPSPEAAGDMIACLRSVRVDEVKRNAGDPARGAGRGG